MKDTLIRYSLVASLAVFLTLLLCKECTAQAYNCGMFGMLQDMYGETYVARFNEDLESIQLESATTCDHIVCKVEVFDIKRRRKNTILWMNLIHPKFDDMPYRIKYPTGSWGIINKN